MTSAPRITFGIIVLNGEPFTRYNLRSLYPFAHEIIVVEGACFGAENIATPDGHSRDGTLEVLREFKAEEDPENKVTVVTAEDEGYPNGFWPGEKHEQSQAYAKRATGDYLWQVDIDEFYRAEDMRAVIQMLRDDPGITTMSFRQLTFWGGLNYWTDGWYLRRGATYFHRLFKWEPGFAYTTHRPPTVIDAKGRNLRDLHWLKGTQTARLGIRLYHYSLLFPKQVIDKCDYYGHADWARRDAAQAWADENYMSLSSPCRVHNVYSHPSWLERFRGVHPQQVHQMMGDIQAGKVDVHLRRTDDIELLLHLPAYRYVKSLLKFWSRVEQIQAGIDWRLKRLKHKLSERGRRFEHSLERWAAASFSRKIKQACPTEDNRQS